ncbi:MULTISPECIES: hypothetical protein [Methylocaldum]|jgi:hypothetical protein|uniref:hypothetical protein n=1 Tax=unclassified Methylocaldum TaxID=2622260 RepID=UPI000989CFF2|nr:MULTISPECIES: hypothetical protein [unclassified Methylocaldum]MBP1148300.1 hypothetical protein [Methylocaldum sp. RMAD-M]MDV3243470.1 hypothetical protein [Methylocaldum sp.]MVF22791.1 hypothetical protein [Methylocaldum sp. BRCS4]
MQQDSGLAGNMILLRGAALWLLMALVLAWCMVGLGFGLPVLPAIFPGKFTRLLQAHLDFLLMSALIFGFYAARVPLPWHVRWAMVVGAFTNSSLFLMQAMFPVLDTPTPSDGLFPAAFRLFLLASIVLTSYGFGKGAVIVLRSTFRND